MFALVEACLTLMASSRETRAHVAPMSDSLSAHWLPHHATTSALPVRTNLFGRCALSLVIRTVSRLSLQSSPVRLQCSACGPWSQAACACCRTIDHIYRVWENVEGHLRGLQQVDDSLQRCPWCGFEIIREDPRRCVLHSCIMLSVPISFWQCPPAAAPQTGVACKFSSWLVDVEVQPAPWCWRCRAAVPACVAEHSVPLTCRCCLGGSISIKTKGMRRLSQRHCCPHSQPFLASSLR